MRMFRYSKSMIHFSGWSKEKVISGEGRQIKNVEWQGDGVSNKSLIYTQSQKKCTVESCVSFAEECRYMNFVVYFIFPMRLVTMFRICVIKYEPAGVTWPWPWVTGEANEFMVHFFWDWVCSPQISIIYTLPKLNICQGFPTKLTSRC